MPGIELSEEPISQNVNTKPGKFPPVIVVNQADEEIGVEMLSEVWRNGLHHRTVRVMLEDDEGRVLLQRRSKEMVLYPGRWDNSAAGHVDQGMSYYAAARQEVVEELGIKDPDIVEMGYFFMKSEYQWRIMNNFNKWYRLRLDGQNVITEKAEVSEVAWFTKEELRRMAKDNPEQMTAGLAYVVTHFY